MQIADHIREAFRPPSRLHFAAVALLIVAGAVGLRADGPPPARFDLSGPSIRVQVTRGGQTLPISSIATLRGGDQLRIQPDFPGDQSAHYLLVAAFLQGSTNPPPESWFTRVETWQKQVRDHGITVTVPDDAQQALIFLAPETGGAFATLRSTVRGKPGIFVRAAEELEQASLDRTRLDKFLEEIQKTPFSGSVPLIERSALLSRTLAVKADPECFARPIDEQSSCLTQSTNSLSLEETPGQSVMASLTTGASAELVGALGGSPLAKGGYYSPYIGSALDMVRLLNGLRTAVFQYLPALVQPVQDTLNLRLNSPPSFHAPRSVLVVPLPDVEPTALPQLHALDPNRVYCLQNGNLVLPVQGAPLVFSTRIAHDLKIQLPNKAGQMVDLAAIPDAARGGFTVNLGVVRPDQLDPEVNGTLHGFWGFDPYEGPSFRFQNVHSAKWIVPAGANPLLVGRQAVLRLEAGDAACVESVEVKLPAGSAKSELTSSVDNVKNDVTGDADKSDSAKDAGKSGPAGIPSGTEGGEKSAAKETQGKLTWKAVSPTVLELQLPLKGAAAGTVSLSIKQFGAVAPDVVTLHAFDEAATLEAFAISVGDAHGMLTGTRLDEVRSLELEGVRFVPEKLRQRGRRDYLGLRAPSEAATAALPPHRSVIAHVALKDGRVLDLQTDVQPPRPKVTLLNKTVKLASETSSFHLGDPNELPQDGRLSFLLKTDIPEQFPHAEQIEVATVDGSSDWSLSVANGGLVLQDSQSVLAILDPLKNLGASAFGPLRFRPVDDQGQKGAWQPLVRLVRIPAFKDVHCPDDPDKPCTLTGSSLFLLDSVASGAQFADAVSVPPGYADTSITVPRPNGALLYVKLRDDPSVVDRVALPVLPDSN